MDKPDIDLTSSTFNFTFDDEVDVDKYQQAIDNKLVLIMKKVNSLLEKLKSNPEKTVIKWPGRKKDIETFEAELKKIIEG